MCQKIRCDGEFKIFGKTFWELNEDLDKKSEKEP